MEKNRTDNSKDGVMGKGGDPGVNISLVTAEKPHRLSKLLRLEENGKLRKEGGGNLFQGTVETKNFSNIKQLAEFLPTLTPAQALAYGVCKYGHVRIVCADQVGAARRSASGGGVGEPIIARTREFFKFPDGPGILMLDYDPAEGARPLSAEPLLGILYGLIPSLMTAPHLIRGSASSHIYHGDTELRGATGWRVLIHVADARDIPRVGKVIYQRSWLGGQGRIAISSAGSLLERGLIDALVWQPERLDFIGGAVCVPPLEQRIPPVKVFNADEPPLDTREVLPSLSQAEEHKYCKLVRDAKKEVELRALEVREEWASRQVEKRLQIFEGDEKKRGNVERRLRQTYMEAASYCRLLGDFELETENGDRVAVIQLLNNPKKYDGMRFADPLEPDYRGDKRIAKAFLKGRRPYINSFAHGGQRYTLHRQRREVQLFDGERDRICREAMAAIRQDGSIFERGGEMVWITTTGEIVPLDLDGLLLLLDRLIMWTKSTGKAGSDGVPKPPIMKDCPMNIAKGVLAMKKDGWDLPPLTAVVTAPTMDPKTGRIVDSAGYDPETGLYFICNDLHRWPGVPERPTPEQVKQAFRVLWEPFSTFPFCDPVGRGVFLGTVLTSPVRVALPTAPGTLISSCVPSSGKTLLGRSLARLAGEFIPTLLSVSESHEEIRKTLLSLGRSGCTVMVFDNISGDFGSDPLCVWLTTEHFTDRILRRSKTVTVPTRALTIMTGNNVRLTGDICRRVLSCYLDPGVEEPWRRKFDLDPVFYCQENRLEMIAAILTILRAGQQMGRVPQDRAGSFETWSDLIRPAVMLIGDLGVLDVADPVDSINSAFSQDPAHIALGELLDTWYDEFGDEAKSLSEVIEHATCRSNEGKVYLYRILEGIANDRGTINAMRLGQWIRKYRGRPVIGLRFELAGSRNNSNLWRVVSLNGDVGDVGDVLGSSRNRKQVTPIFSGNRNNPPRSPDSPEQAVLPELNSGKEMGDHQDASFTVVNPAIDHLHRLGVAESLDSEGRLRLGELQGTSTSQTEKTQHAYSK